MAEVVFEGATRIYDGTTTPAVNRLSLEIADGEFIVLVGPSGSGKSTALRMLAGLEPLDEGCIRIAGEDVTERAPKDRDIAMVFQNYALFPHLDVAGNIEFGLRLRHVPKNERKGISPARGTDIGSRGVPRSKAQSTVGWPTSTGGHGTGDRARAEGVLDG